MPTQEERIAALEQTMSEFQPTLRGVTYEVSIVKGLIVTQTEITGRLREDMNGVKKRLDKIENHLEMVEQRLNDHTTALNMLNQRIDHLETKSDEHTALLTQILVRLPKREL